MDFYPVFFGTLISIVSLTYFVVAQRDRLHSRTLSELATIEQKMLVRFRNILLLCGSLFAITMFAFIVPRAPYKLITLILSLMVIIGELLVGVIPAHRNTIKVHEYLAGLMGFGMVGLPYLFWASFRGNFRFIEGLLGLLMTGLTCLMFTDKSRRRFIMYELMFIFASHISIAFAALALK